MPSTTDLLIAVTIYYADGRIQMSRYTPMTTARLLLAVGQNTRPEIALVEVDSR